jgi:two-component system LytT family response regulator
LSDAISKAKKSIATNNNSKIDGLLTANDSIFVKDGEKCWFVKLQDVYMIESVGNYAQLFFGKEKPLIHRSLNQLTERLDERTFFRANRKQIINLTFIDKIEPFFNGALNAIMKTGDKVEISRRQSVKFKDQLSL